MIVCGSCGAEAPDAFRFCGACGAPLAPAAPPRESRKTVTILFCDVAGSTALGERLDPESLRRVMRRYFEEMQLVIERHGGRVEKFIGDAVMAVFGLPRVHEDDALRAVRAAAEIRERLPAVAADAGVRLTWRTGVNTGTVVAGEQGLVVGDAVNLAARLEQAAPLGEILLGPDTYRLVRAAVEVEPVAPLTLKGKSRPVRAQRLLRVAPRAEALARRLDEPIVGRERELAALAAAYAAALEERACRVCTVLGPAGIGKTRLVRGWLDTLDGEATVVHGRCLHYGEGITFWPLVEVLMQLGEPAATVLAHVAEGGAASPQELFWEVRTLLERLAALRPLVVVLEDLQWAEPTFHELLEHVAARSRSSPILLLCVARPELLDDEPAWAQGAAAAAVTLGPLAAAECARLVDQLDPAVEPALRDRIVAASEGNPLFAEEMLAFVREGGGAGLPPTIQALVAARLEQLRDELRAVVERGAIEGKVFHRGAVLALAPDRLGADVDGHLGALVGKELIDPEPPVVPEDRAYRFRTLLIRDAAYDALPKQTRAELHERFAGWLERRARDLVELDEIAGWHLEQAVRFRRELSLPVADELAARAARHLAAAGRRASDRLDLPAAVNLLRRARELAPAGDPQRPRLAIELAEALIPMTTDAREVEPLLDEAAADPGTRLHATVARIAWTLSIAPQRLGEEAHTALADVIAGFRAAGDDLGLAKAYLELFELHWLASQCGPAGVALDAAIEHAARAGAEAIVAKAAGWRCGLLVFGPHGPEATERALAEMEAGDPGPFLRASAALVRSDLHRRAQRFDEARAACRAGDALMVELGFELLAASSGQFTGLIELDAGDAPEAVRLLRESLELSRRLGERAFASTTAAILAQALLEAGELDEAMEMAETAKADSAPEDAINFAASDEVIARVRLARGDVAGAEALAHSAVEHAWRTDFPTTRAQALFALATVLAAAGRHDEAAEAAHQSLALYEQKGEQLAAGRVRALLAELTAADPAA